jgi:hypothetical protein
MALKHGIKLLLASAPGSIRPSVRPSDHSALSLQPCWTFGAFFQFLNPIYNVYDFLDGGSARLKAATCTQDNIKTEQTETSMPRVGPEPMNPVLERARTVHALDRAAVVIGTFFSYSRIITASLFRETTL